MSRAGQRNYKGVNTQAKSALLLFLTHYAGGNLSAIVLEDANWEDYTLQFTSGKKIVCESKAWGKPINLNTAVGILENIASRDTSLNKGDEIVIVCNKADGRLVRDLKYLTYGMPIDDLAYFRDYRKHEKLTPRIIELLKITTFFELPSGDDNKTGYLYTEMLAHFASLIPFWLPQGEMKRFMKSVLIDQIYEKSAAGKTFTRAEFASLIAAYRDEKIENTGAFDSKKRAITKQMSTIVKAIKDKDEKYQIEGENLIALSAKPMHMNIALDLIGQQTPLVLRDWRKIWDALIDKSYGFSVLHIFEKSINTKANARFIIGFLNAHLERLSSPLVDRHNREYAIEVLGKVLKAYPDLASDVLIYLATFVKPRIPLYWSIMSRPDVSYEKENVAKVLGEIYGYVKLTSSTALIASVIDFISETFNIAEDASEHALLAPPGAYAIIRDWVASDFYENFPKFREILVSQYKKSTHYKGKLSGWELNEGMESGWVHAITLYDHNFIRLVLRPVFEAQYCNDRGAFWRYLVSEAIAPATSDVSEVRPDYLTRAAIPTIIREYIDHDSVEALEIIHTSFDIHKGVVDRAKLIFIELLQDKSATDEQKWSLVKSFLDKQDGLPGINEFAEQLTLQITANGNTDSLTYIEKWLTSPEYLAQQHAWRFNIDQIIGNLLDNSDKRVSEMAVTLLKAYLTGEDFQASLGKHIAWDVASLVAKLIRISPQEGVATLMILYGLHEGIPPNVQAALTSPLTKLDKENKELIALIYQEFIEPILVQELKGKADKIAAQFTDRHARENFVQFAKLLTEAGLYEEGLKLVEIFMDDTDPPLDNYPDDPEGTFNYHEKIKAGGGYTIISTVRGWCAWALQQISGNGGQGKPYIGKAITLVQRLSQDENYYVRVQSLVPLASLAAACHYIMASGNDERFMSLDDADKVEDIAFTILENPENQMLPAVMDGLAHIFGNLRHISAERARTLLETYSNLTFEKGVVSIAPLYIFFAEYRNAAFKSAKLKKIFGDALYEKINYFDDKPFKDLLVATIKNAPKEVRRHLVWLLWRDAAAVTIEKGNRDGVSVALRYLKLFLDGYDHDTFELIYHFVEDHIEEKPDECLTLWKEAIKAEHDFVNAHAKQLNYHHDWWGSPQTDSILHKVRNIRGEQEFLVWLNLLLDYPLHLPALFKPRQMYDALKSITAKGKDKTLERFQDVYPYIYAEELAKGADKTA